MRVIAVVEGDGGGGVGDEPSDQGPLWEGSGRTLDSIL